MNNATDLVLLYGGQDSNGAFLNDTWEFRNHAWVNLSSKLTVSPPALSTAGLVWDARDGYFVLFGGNIGYGASSLNVTWKFANGSWTNISTAVAPSPRFAPGMVFDPADSEVLLFGGIRGGFGSFSDTWTFVGGTWTNITGTASTAPSPRGFVGLTFDARLQQVILFGGREYPNSIDYNDTWAFSGGSWTQLLAGNGYGPSLRRGSAFAYDPHYGVDVLYGGEDQNFNELTDDWIYNGTSWTNLSALVLGTVPPGRFDGGFVFVSDSTGLLLFGGCAYVGCGSVAGDTWVYQWNLSAALSSSKVKVAVGGQITLRASASGGSWEYAYEYLGLPTGCVSANVSSLACTPSGEGNFTPEALVGDLDAPGSNVTVFGPTLEVVPALIAVPETSRSTLDVGEVVWVNSTVSGGAGAYTASYSGLPAGCIGGNTTSLVCSPTASGVYTPQLTIQDGIGDVARATFNLSVNGPVHASVAVSSTVIDLGETVVLSAAATGGSGSYSYLWSGLPAGCPVPTGATATCAPSGLSSFNVSVTATDALGGSATAFTGTVSVLADPSASISASPSSGPAPLGVTFGASIRGGEGPYSYSWNFGDGGTGFVSNLTYRYSTPGTYQVNLWVNDSLGYSAHASAVVTVVSSFTGTLKGSVGLTEVGLSVLFNLSIVGGVAPITFNWTGLPPGCAGADRPLLSCSPSQKGAYVIVAEAVDSTGASVSADFALQVLPPLSAVAAGTSAGGCGAPWVVNFTSTVVGGKAPVSYLWQFGDGSSSTSSQPEHSYDRPIASGVGLEVTDSLGASVVANATLPAFTSCPASAGSGAPTLLVGLGAASVVAAAAVGILLALRRRRGQTSPLPAPEEFPPEEADPGETSDPSVLQP